ncbi:MAG: VWD domain-containing protein, partial [Ilumatobacteraceae bacterium]
DFDTGATVQVKSKGPHDDKWTITGKPDWLAVSPLTGDLHSGEPTDEEAFDVEISTGTPGSVDCWEPRTATLTVSTKHRGAADLSVKEDDPCYLKWDPATVTGPGAVTANLLTKGRSADAAFVEEAGFPDWLHLVSPTGLVSMPKNGGAEMSIPFSFTVDERTPKCTVQLPRSFEFIVHTGTRGDATLKITDPKVAPLTDCGLKFTPNQLTGSGASTMTLRDDDLAADETANWEVDPATLPEWLTATPANGTIGSDQPVPVFFAVLGSNFDACAGRPQRSATVAVTAEVPTGAFSTKTVRGQIKVTRPAIPPADCPTTTGGAHGDPHMLSMDGVPFEGQIIGEYTYLRTPAGEGDPLQLVVRTQPTSGLTHSHAPTSVTAAALTFHAAKVEVYIAAGAVDVLVDGELIILEEDSPLQVAEGLSVVRSGITLRIDTPSVTVNLSRMFWMTHLFNLSVSAKIGSPLEGLLGSPDGDPSNDFIGGDGTAYTTAQIQQNQPPAFFDYVASWRLTDQSASPFTRPFAQFGQANPGFDSQILADFGDDVDAALAGTELICDGGLTPQQRYGLALEFSFGPNADVGRFICSYAVNGIATADGAPVAGLKVTMDAVGLKACNSTTGIDGRYFCVLTVDLDEVRAATAPLLPLT